MSAADRLFGLALAAALLSAPAAAEAHDGTVLGAGKVGAYTYTLDAGPVQPDGRQVDYTVTLRRGDLPEEAARVTVSVLAEGRWTPPKAARLDAGSYEALLDIDDWRTAPVRLVVDGPAGAARAQVTPRTDSQDGPSAAVLAVSAVLGLLAVVAALVASRRRKRARL